MTPDGYEICPACGHHTSAAVAGHCTVIVPEFSGDNWTLPYCNCDCYKAIHGISLSEKIFGKKES
jgi:hypothetical protein